MAMDVKVEELMVTEVKVIAADDSVQRAAQAMNEQNVPVMVVIDKNEVIGIVTEEDLVRKVVANNKHPSQTLVGDVMTPSVMAVKPDENIIDVSIKMRKEDITSMPVVSDDRGLLGIITERDMTDVYPKITEYVARHFEGQ